VEQVWEWARWKRRSCQGPQLPCSGGWAAPSRALTCARRVCGCHLEEAHVCPQCRDQGVRCVEHEGHGRGAVRLAALGVDVGAAAGAHGLGRQGGGWGHEGARRGSARPAWRQAIRRCNAGASRHNSPLFWNNQMRKGLSLCRVTSCLIQTNRWHDGGNAERNLPASSPPARAVGTAARG
jgi:hypothetical protein